MRSATSPLFTARSVAPEMKYLMIDSALIEECGNKDSRWHDSSIKERERERERDREKCLNTKAMEVLLFM